MLIGQAQISALIPHAGRMCLIDEVLEWDGGRIRCRTGSHRDPDNPMRVAGELPALCAIEYAAQAMALHGRLTLQDETPRTGYLASVRDVVYRAIRLDDIREDLVIEAQLLMGEGVHVVYGFSVSAQAALLLEGRAAVVLAA